MTSNMTSNMISATNLANFNAATVGLESPSETKTPTASTQLVAGSVSPDIQLAAAKAQSEAAAPNTSLTQMLDTVVLMLQNLMKMIQGLIVSPGASDKTPAATPAPATGMPAEEPATIIPVSQQDTAPQTPTAAPAENKTTQTSNTKTSQDVEASGSAGKVRAKPAKGAKRRKSRKNSINGRGQFLWKPKSEKDGKLAILLPKQYTGKVASVQVLGPDGQQKLAQGRPSGVGNENREHFRFNSPGEAFPDGSIVLVTLKDGSTREVAINNTAARFTR